MDRAVAAFDGGYWATMSTGTVLPVPTTPFDPKQPDWANYLNSLKNIATTAAPSDARFLVETSHVGLSNEKNLGALLTGFLFLTSAAGIGTPSTTLNGAAFTSLPAGVLTGILPALNASALVALTGANIAGGGVYTPTLTNVANLSASTAFQAHYTRVGDVVLVSGKVSVDPTTTLTATELGISLPIASNLGAEEDCGGVAFASAIAGQGAAIRGDATNNRAAMVWLASDVTNQPMHFIFQYRVI